MDMNLINLWDIVKNRRSWDAAVHVVVSIGHEFATEQQQQKFMVKVLVKVGIKGAYLSASM